MADISKIKMPNNTSYDLKDAAARESIAALPIDVQVNGTSVVSNRIANIPIATPGNYGVIKTDIYGSMGIAPIQDAQGNYTGEIGVYGASNGQIKTGTEVARPITPAKQEKSVFYGLAKAAGDTTQSVSANSVGTYTDAAKDSIQSMLGIHSLFATHETSTASVAHAINSIFIMDSKLYKATSEISVGDAITAGTNCIQTTISETYASIESPVFTGSISMGRKANTDIGSHSVAMGTNVTASNNYTYAVGGSTIASGLGAFAEGVRTNASGYCAHASGYMTTASGNYAYSMGNSTIASGDQSLASGIFTTASIGNAFAMGAYNYSSTPYATWIKDTSYSIGDKVTYIYNDKYYGYECIEANSDSSFVFSKWKFLPSNGELYFTVGNGQNDNNKSNAYAIDWHGNGYYMGDIYINCNANSANGEKLVNGLEVVKLI